MFNHIIITRFSVKLNDHYFQKQPNLFTDERLSYRFSLFENVYLQGFQWIKETNFKIILIIDKQLPIIWFNKLKKLIALDTRMCIYTWNPGTDNINNSEWIHRLIPNLKNQKYLVQTRIDDDDTFLPNFILNMHTSVKSLIKHKVPDNVFAMVSFIDGINIVMYSDKFYAKTQRARCGGAGLTMITMSSDNACTYKFDHSRLNQYPNMRIFQQKRGIPLFIVTAHEMNDSHRYQNLIKKITDFKKYNTLDEIFFELL